MLGLHPEAASVDFVPRNLLDELTFLVYSQFQGQLLIEVIAALQRAAKLLSEPGKHARASTCTGSGIEAHCHRSMSAVMKHLWGITFDPKHVVTMSSFGKIPGKENPARGKQPRAVLVVQSIALSTINLKQ